VANLPLDIQVVGDSLVAGTEQPIEDAVNNLVGTLVPSLVEPLLGGLAFTLPSFSGIGLTSLDAYGSGPQQDWLTASIGLGAVSYGDPTGGCGGEGDTGLGGDAAGSCGGCESSCESGCEVGGARAAGPLAFLVAWWSRRRRERSGR
jgi:hypothetical protein